MTAVTGPLLRSRQSRHFVIVTSTFTAGPPPRFPRYLAASAGRFPNKRAGGRPRHAHRSVFGRSQIRPRDQAGRGRAFEIARAALRLAERSDLANEMIA